MNIHKYKSYALSHVCIHACTHLHGRGHGHCIFIYTHTKVCTHTNTCTGVGSHHGPRRTTQTSTSMCR